MKYAVCWTWGKHRKVKTKKDGRHVMKVWARWYERLGWKVESRTKGEAYVAYPPDYVNDGVISRQEKVVHAICLRLLPN